VFELLSTTFCGPSCRYLYLTSQLGVLDGATVVAFVILSPRIPVPDTDSLSFVPVLVGPWSAGGSGRCCYRRPRLLHDHLDQLFPSCSRQSFAVHRAATCRESVSSASLTVLQQTATFSTLPPGIYLFPTQFCSPSTFVHLIDAKWIHACHRTPNSIR